MDGWLWAEKKEKKMIGQAAKIIVTKITLLQRQQFIINLSLTVLEHAMIFVPFC